MSNNNANNATGGNNNAGFSQAVHTNAINAPPTSLSLGAPKLETKPLSDTEKMKKSTYHKEQLALAQTAKTKAEDKSKPSKK
ncbi:hypothetical protein EXIGLDRAFT_726247 [Exidia glandulosa HHB12029]|uniref:Uncharacterized protein n=1 Tax=Exidia glandulosa HHB12029 TaxID=1314781 RepID=A0A165MF70_EXIGL|nr:hypothetical protein EXIGLDRAFT_726247 [Exidia glandulosa HHB12029]